MLRKIFVFFIALICLLCSLLGLIPIIGNSVQATITENSSRIVNVKRAGRQVYVNKNGFEQPKTRTEYTYSYEFSVNGEKYTGCFSEIKQEHKKGDSITVYYLPFYPKIHSSMKPIHLYVLCGICLLSGILIMRSVFTGRRPEINIGSGNALNLGPKYPTNTSVPQKQNIIQNPQPVQQIIQTQPQSFQQAAQTVKQTQNNTSNPSGYAFCPKCGTAVGSDFAFCMKCGYKL